MPEWNWSNLNFWSQIAFAFGGLELGSIMSGEIRDPRRTVRRAAWISCLAIGGFYILGTFSILALLPPERISVVTGLAQAGEAAARQWGLPWLTPFLGCLIVVGIMGQFGAWIGGSARLAFSIGLDRYLPAAFGKLHPRWRTPHVALLTMGIASTVFLILMQFGESLRTGYQLLVDMTVVSYFIPFAYLFAAAWKHGYRWSAASGMIVTLAGIGFSFIPPGRNAFRLALRIEDARAARPRWWERAGCASCGGAAGVLRMNGRLRQAAQDPARGADRQPLVDLIRSESGIQVRNPLFVFGGHRKNRVF
jgi:amino acid transporter